MKLKPVKIRSNDFSSEYATVAESLGRLLNPFFDDLLLAFNKNLTVEDNLPFEFVTLDVTVNSIGVPTSNKTLTTKLSNLKGYICLNINDLSNSGVYPSASPLVITRTSGNSVNIDRIIGLPANNAYRLILIGIS